MNKKLLSLLLLACYLPVIGQTTGQWVFQKKAATGYDKVNVTPAVSSLWALDGSGAMVLLPQSGFGPGTVTSVSVVTANGLSGTVATATTTPAITLDISGLDATKIGAGGVTSTEFGYIGTLTSDAQTQITARALLTTNSFSGVQNITNTTAATSSTTGALIVAGGVGIAKDSWINGVRVGFGGGDIASNLVLGVDALPSNTTGSNNTAIGDNSFFSNTTGSNNTAVGHQSFNSNTTGSNNTAIGYYSLNRLTGSNNTAIGYNSGRFQANGLTALLPINSVYIGADARGFNNSDDNSIVIGYNAIGEGANKTVIGNSSTTGTHLFGTLTATLTNSTGLPLTTGVTGTLSVGNGGTGATTFTDGGVLIGNVAGVVQTTSAGTSGQVLTSNGAGVDPTFQTSGKVAQMVVTTSDTETSTAVTTPAFDTSIPQNTEGTALAEYDTAFTPKNSGSTLIIEFDVMCANGTTAAAIFFLCVDSTADALATRTTYITAGQFTTTTLRFSVSAASTTARTYKMRFGTEGGTLYTNRSVSTANLFGTTLTSSLKITEVLP